MGARGDLTITSLLGLHGIARPVLLMLHATLVESGFVLAAVRGLGVRWRPSTITPRLLTAAHLTPRLV